MSRTTSGCVTTPSSLLRTHAPDPRPLDVCGFPSTSSLCRLPSAPAGPWPFPTLSPRSLYRCLDPYPVVSFRCPCSFLPGWLRPHVRVKTFDTQETPCLAASTGETFSGLQSFVYLQAPMLARPPSCTYRCVSTGQSGRLHHASRGSLPIPGCGIATCSTRATNTAGLSPARSRPCRPLRTPPFPLPSAEIKTEPIPALGGGRRACVSVYVSGRRISVMKRFDHPKGRSFAALRMTLCLSLSLSLDGQLDYLC